MDSAAVPCFDLLRLFRVFYFPWYLCNCMTSLYDIAFWPWSNSALCCPAPAGPLTGPLLLLEGLSVRCIAKLFSHFSLSLSLFFSKPGCSVKLNFSCLFYSLCPLSLSLLNIHSSLWSKPSQSFAATYISPNNLVKRSFLWSVCCLVVLETCCPSLWQHSWSWWTMALFPGTLSLWPLSRRSVKKISLNPVRPKFLVEKFAGCVILYPDG